MSWADSWTGTCCPCHECEGHFEANAVQGMVFHALPALNNVAETVGYQITDAVWRFDDNELHVRFGKKP